MPMHFDTTASTPDEQDAELARFVAKVESERDASLAVIERLSARTRKQIACGYRKLVPLSMATLFVVGMVEYKRRAERYQRFTRLALNSQATLSAIENR
ncbi:hypothetical protein WI37_20240 [Burkholderia ubonensis]|nr:hypothetical protein WI37_20240 [Burkholderia ubonensis]